MVRSGDIFFLLLIFHIHHWRPPWRPKRWKVLESPLHFKLLSSSFSHFLLFHNGVFPQQIHSCLSFPISISGSFSFNSFLNYLVIQSFHLLVDPQVDPSSLSSRRGFHVEPGTREKAVSISNFFFLLFSVFNFYSTCLLHRFG